MSYDLALQHLTQCLYEHYQCPFDCVKKNGRNSKEIAEKGILGQDMQKHLAVCDFNQIKCENCQLDIVVLDKDKHDCMKELKQLIYSKEVNIMATKEDFGINYDRLNLRCDNNHALECIRSKPRSNPAYSGGAQCNVCRQSALEHMEYFYHCK